MKVAVVGIGKLGKRHLEKWSQIKDVKIVGVMARSENHLKEVSQQYHTSYFKTIEELVDKVDVDMIDICTPTYTHGQFIKQAALAKKHVICEKPLALSASESEELITVCAQNNVQLFVGHTLQFFQAYEAAKHAIQNGQIGQESMIQMTRGVPYPADEREWYVDEKRSGGLFLDLGVHEFEWILSTFGEVESVHTNHVRYLEQNKHTIVYGIVSLKLVSGATAHIELSWDEPAFKASFKMVGDKGKITYEHRDSAPLFTQNDDTSTETTLNHLSQEDPYVRQLKHFMNCILDKEKPLLLLENAAKAVQIAEAAKQSAQEDRPVVMKKAK